MLGLTGFYWYDAEQKKNECVIERIRTEAADLMNSPEVNIGDKAIHLISEERYKAGTLIPYLEKRSYKDRITLGIETYRQLLYIDKQHETDLKKQLSAFIAKNLSEPAADATAELLLSEGNKFVILLAMDQYYLPDEKKTEMLDRISGKNYGLVLRFLKDKTLFQPLIPTQMNVAIQ